MSSDAELFPRIMAAGLALFGVVELSITIGSKSNREETGFEESNSRLTGKCIAYMGTFFLLVMGLFISFPVIGFELSAIIFMIASMCLLGGKNGLRMWPVAVVFPLALILVFRFGLDVRFPTLPFLE